LKNVAEPVIKNVSDNTRAIPREEQLPMILGISLEMLNKAKNNDWEAVIELESQRNALIADFFTTTISTDDGHTVAYHIDKVLEIDRQLIELGSNERDKMRENLQKLSNGRHALKVYSAV